MIKTIIREIYEKINEYESICLEFQDGTVYYYDRPTKELQINKHRLRVNIDFKSIIDNNIDNIVYISIVEDGKQIFKLDLRN